MAILQSIVWLCGLRRPFFFNIIVRSTFLRQLRQHLTLGLFMFEVPMIFIDYLSKVCLPFVMQDDDAAAEKTEKCVHSQGNDISIFIMSVRKETSICCWKIVQNIQKQQTINECKMPWNKNEPIKPKSDHFRVGWFAKKVLKKSLFRFLEPCSWPNRTWHQKWESEEDCRQAWVSSIGILCFRSWWGHCYWKTLRFIRGDDIIIIFRLSPLTGKETIFQIVVAKLKTKRGRRECFM